jgi:hypothetical protein
VAFEINKFAGANGGSLLPVLRDGKKWIIQIFGSIFSTLQAILRKERRKYNPKNMGHSRHIARTKDTLLGPTVISNFTNNDTTLGFFWVTPVCGNYLINKTFHGGNSRLI